MIDIKHILLTHWNIHDTEINPICTSAWAVGDLYILKIGHSIQGLQRNIKVIKGLLNYHLPVPIIIKTVGGSDYIIDRDQYYFLTGRIKGEHITDIYSSDYIQLSYNLGISIARLHMTFKDCQSELGLSKNNFYKEITGWIMESFKRNAIIKVPSEVLREVITELEKCYPKLERQLIHRDIHSGNLLLMNNELTGYLDFDLCQIDARIFDLCYMALNFLTGHVNESDKTERWFQITQQIVTGYESLIVLTSIEKSSIFIMMLAIEMLFIAYFTNHREWDRANNSIDVLMWVWKNKSRFIF